MTVYPDAVRLGSVPAGDVREVAVTATNQTAGPVRLIGGTADCDCVATDSLPLTLPPGGSARVYVRLRGGPQAAEFSRRIWLDTDPPSRVRPVVRLVGHHAGAASAE